MTRYHLKSLLILLMLNPEFFILGLPMVILIIEYQILFGKRMVYKTTIK